VPLLKKDARYDECRERMTSENESLLLLLSPRGFVIRDHNVQRSIEEKDSAKMNARYFRGAAYSFRVFVTRYAYRILDEARRLGLRETMSEKIYSLGTTVFVGYAVSNEYI